MHVGWFVAENFKTAGRTFDFVEIYLDDKWQSIIYLEDKMLIWVKKQRCKFEAPLFKDDFLFSSISQHYDDCDNDDTIDTVKSSCI